jgi:hypothetical protein
VLDYHISEADYFDKVISIIPKVGLATMPPYNYIIAGIAAWLMSVTGLFGYIIYQRIMRAKNNKHMLTIGNHIM